MSGPQHLVAAPERTYELEAEIELVQNASRFPPIDSSADCHRSAI